jgi:hypothetical protein
VVEEKPAPAQPSETPMTPAEEKQAVAEGKIEVVAEMQPAEAAPASAPRPAEAQAPARPAKRGRITK